MKPYLSIIVPVYKAELYLHQCIDSILAQTFKDFELILVNDGSPDSCPAICDEYAEKDVRVKVIHKTNGGHTSARKEGLKASKGEYIGFVDSDDWIENNMYESLCGAALKYNVDIAVCDVIHVCGAEEVKHKQSVKPGVYDKASLIRDVYPVMLYSGEFYIFGLYPAVWNKIFRRALLENNLIKVDETIRIGEDAACTYPCLLDAESLCVLDNKYLYHYRQIASSITSSYDAGFLDRVLVLYKLLKDINKEKAVFDLSLQLYYYAAGLIIKAVNDEFENSNNKGYREKRRLLTKMYLNNDINEVLNTISLKSIPFKPKFYIWLLRKKMDCTSVFLHFYFSMVKKGKINLCRKKSLI